MARKNYQPQDKDKPFPTRLRALMEERGITQEELGKAVGKSRPTISCYANGTAFPDVETVVELAQFFGTSADYLLGMPNSVRTLDAGTRSVCACLGISEETLERLRALGSFACFEDVVKADWFYSLVMAIDLLRFRLTEAAFSVEAVRDVFGLDPLLTGEDLSTLEKKTPVQCRTGIRNCVYDVAECCENLADEVSGYRKVQTVIEREIARSAERYARFLREGASDGGAKG